jgi:hypothetical protein
MKITMVWRQMACKQGARYVTKFRSMVMWALKTQHGPCAHVRVEMKISAMARVYGFPVSEIKLVHVCLGYLRHRDAIMLVMLVHLQVIGNLMFDQCGLIHAA